jgi:hypothetical protein
VNQPTDLVPQALQNLPVSNAGKPFGLEERIPDEHCFQSEKKINMPLIFDLTCLTFFRYGEDMLFH